MPRPACRKKRCFSSVQDIDFFISRARAQIKSIFLPGVYGHEEGLPRVVTWGRCERFENFKVAFRKLEKCIANHIQSTEGRRYWHLLSLLIDWLCLHSY